MRERKRFKRWIPKSPREYQNIDRVVADQKNIDFELLSRFVYNCFKGNGFISRPNDLHAGVDIESTYAGLNLIKAINPMDFLNIREGIKLEVETTNRFVVKFNDKRFDINYNNLSLLYRASLILFLSKRISTDSEISKEYLMKIINKIRYSDEPLRRLYELYVSLKIMSLIDEDINKEALDILKKYKGEIGFIENHNRFYFRSNYNAFSVLGIMVNLSYIDVDYIQHLVGDVLSKLKDKIKKSYRLENDGFSLNKKHHPIIWDQFDVLGLIHILNDLKLVKFDELLTKDQCKGIEEYLAKSQVQKPFIKIGNNLLGGFRSSIHSYNVTLLQTNAALMVLSLCKRYPREVDYYLGVFI